MVDVTSSTWYELGGALKSRKGDEFNDWGKENGGGGYIYLPS